MLKRLINKLTRPAALQATALILILTACVLADGLVSRFGARVGILCVGALVVAAGCLVEWAYKKTSDESEAKEN